MAVELACGGGSNSFAENLSKVRGEIRSKHVHREF